MRFGLRDDACDSFAVAEAVESQVREVNREASFYQLAKGVLPYHYIPPLIVSPHAEIPCPSNKAFPHSLFRKARRRLCQSWHAQFNGHHLLNRVESAVELLEALPIAEC